MPPRSQARLQSNSISQSLCNPTRVISTGRITMPSPLRVLLPDIQMASTRFSKLAEAERTGSLTGTSGSGTVVQLLTQMGSQLGNLSQEVGQSGDKVRMLYEQGGKHIEKMRTLISDRGPINERSDNFARETMSLMGVIASLQQTSVAPAVKRAADGLVSGFIAPAAGGRGELADRQTSVVGKVEQAVSAQAKALSDAADKILAQPRIEPERFQSLSTAEAVLRYAGDFIPSWAGAISIDLMPAVFVFILCIVHATIRKDANPEVADTMTAAQLLAALRLARDVEQAGRLVPAEVTSQLDENVTAFAPSPSRKKGIAAVDKRERSWKAAFIQWLHNRPDDAVLRWLFRGMIVATIAVVGLDYTELDAALKSRLIDEPSTTGLPSAEPLPSTERTTESRPAMPSPTTDLKHKNDARSTCRWTPICNGLLSHLVLLNCSLKSSASAGLI